MHDHYLGEQCQSSWGHKDEYIYESIEESTQMFNGYEDETRWAFNEQGEIVYVDGNTFFQNVDE